MLRYYEGATPGKSKRKTPPPKAAEYEAKRRRVFIPSWKDSRPWLNFNGEQNLMTCTICIKYCTAAGSQTQSSSFVSGSSNLKKSAIIDHECSKAHIKALELEDADKRSAIDKLNFTRAGQAIQSLREAEKGRLNILFRNAHALMKQNRPLSDFAWLAMLDKQKGLDTGNTYLNNNAALDFIRSIASSERARTHDMLKTVHFFSFMIDGTTDISGDEQEAVYLRFYHEGAIYERFLAMGTPESTCSNHVYEFVVGTLKSNNIDTEKLIGMASDGASNMVGKKGGLAALLRSNVNAELLNMHCFAHRLELSFRDVFKKNNLYEKLMTLLIGLYYFYHKQYKNKSGLIKSMDAVDIKGVLPTKVTGTRWLPHLSRGIKNLLRSYKAFEAHLATISYSNPKGEGLYKIMTSKDVVCFVLFLMELLDPLMRVSLKLQRPESSVAECYTWISSTIDLLDDYKSRDCEAVNDVLATGSYEGIALRGNTPSFAYKDTVIDGLIEALKERFDLDDESVNVYKATNLLHPMNWPKMGSDKQKDFGEAEIHAVCKHFQQTLAKARLDFSTENTISEFRLLKKILYKEFGQDMQKQLCSDLSTSQHLRDFPDLNLIIELLSCLPPTSVSCETTFSQLKLIKTSRRTSLTTQTLNDIIQVKLESPTIQEFDPKNSIDQWLVSAKKPRLTSYQRSKQSKTSESGKVLKDNIQTVDLTCELEDSHATVSVIDRPDPEEPETAEPLVMVTQTDDGSGDMNSDADIVDNVLQHMCMTMDEDEETEFDL